MALSQKITLLTLKMHCLKFFLWTPQYIDKDGTIWKHEHGPKGGDEINILEPGLNYGWPAICYCVDYSGAQITPFTEENGTTAEILAPIYRAIRLYALFGARIS